MYFIECIIFLECSRFIRLVWPLESVEVVDYKMCQTTGEMDSIQNMWCHGELLLFNCRANKAPEVQTAPPVRTERSESPETRVFPVPLD